MKNFGLEIEWAAVVISNVDLPISPTNLPTINDEVAPFHNFFTLPR